MKRINHVLILAGTLSWAVFASQAVRAQDLNAQLLSAAQQGDVSQVASLLDRGASIETADSKGFRPLHRAAYSGMVDAARLLLDRGAGIEAQINDQSTPLILAAYWGRPDVARLLIQRGANVNARDKFGKNSLDYARERSASPPNPLPAGADFAAVVSLLEANGGSGTSSAPNSQPPSVNAQLLDAAQSGNTGLMSSLLGQGADIETTDSKGFHPLHRAAYGGSVEATTLLLDRGANIEAKINDESTPLIIAAYWGQAGVVRYLLQRGANASAKDNQNKTSLDWARARKTSPPNPLPAGADFAAVVSILEGSGPSSESSPAPAEPSSLNTQLLEAAKDGGASAIAGLIDRGAGVEAADKSGLRPLHWAAARGHVEAVRLLLKRGANVDSRSSDQSTPLIVAAYWGQAGTVKLLLAHKAARNAKDNQGKTALDWARERKETPPSPVPAGADYAAVVSLLEGSHASVSRRARPNVRRNAEPHGPDTSLSPGKED